MFDKPHTLHLPVAFALRVWGVAAFLCCNGMWLLAQNPSFVASLDVKEVIVGVPFELTFTLNDAEGQRFTPPSLRDFKQAGTVSESRGMSIIKGRTSSKQAWSYTLEATRPGNFMIGSALVTVAGRQLSTAPLNVKVLSPATLPKGAVGIPPGRDDEVFIVGNLSSQKAFPGQQVTWRLTLYTRVAIEGADLISLPSFDGFYSREKRRFDTRTQYQTIKGKKYAVKTLHEEALFPQSTGDINIGVAQIRVGLDQPGAQGFFFGPKPVTLTTQPAILKVIPLPEPVPENFSGGVGHYTWDVVADTNALTTDDALTLTVKLKGNGDSRRFAAPKFSVPSTSEIFEPRVLEEEEYESEAEILHSKSLEYVVLPKEPGVQEILPTLSYFDVDSNRYCTLQTAPIRFEVTAGKNYRPPSAQDTIPVPVQTAVQIGAWERTLDFFTGPVFWGAMALLFLSVGTWFLWRNRKKRPSESVKMPKLKGEPRISAQQRLAQVATLRFDAPPEQFYNELLKSLQSYITTRLNLSPAQLNQATLRTKLSERRVTPIRIQAFLSILQTCEQAVFSGHSDASKMESDWRAAEVVVQELEKEML